MKKGIVAIVGRANVGKSTLFNRIIGERVSIVEDVPGVTRDRIYAKASWLTKEFRVIDTGGIELKNADFREQIKTQAEIAIEEADVIIFVVNGREGLTSEDNFVARMLQKSGKPVLLAVNKIVMPRAASRLLIAEMSSRYCSFRAVEAMVLPTTPS